MPGPTTSTPTPIATPVTTTSDASLLLRQKSLLDGLREALRKANVSDAAATKRKHTFGKLKLTSQTWEQGQILRGWLLADPRGDGTEDFTRTPFSAQQFKIFARIRACPKLPNPSLDYRQYAPEQEATIQHLFLGKKFGPGGG